MDTVRTFFHSDLNGLDASAFDSIDKGSIFGLKVSETLSYNTDLLDDFDVFTIALLCPTKGKRSDHIREYILQNIIFVEII